MAQGYIDVDGRVRSNVLHLPVRGVGDGGAYSTVADMQSFWTGLFAGDIVSRSSGSPRWSGHAATRPSTADATGSASGSIRRATVVFLEGADAGISCRSVHDPATGVIYTVISNSSDGAWPILELLADRLGTAAEGRAVDEASASA